jgi:dTMP kinase
MVKVRHQGAFICIEGIDGSGKTTQAHHLVKALRKAGYDAVYTSEPTNGVYGKLIKNHLLQGEFRIPPILEALLFTVDRFDHVQREITPLLNQGKIIICDRYLYSSIAYQGTSHQNVRWVKEINKQVKKPDLAIYIDIPPETVINRLKRRRKTVMETLETQRQVRKQYLKLVDEKKFIKIYGHTSKKQVAEAIQNIVLDFLEKK